MDYKAAQAAIYPARLELGMRKWRIARSGSGDALLVQIGMGANSCWVEVTVNGLDLYDVTVFKTRGATRTVQFTLHDIYADKLAPALVARWCEHCSQKGW